MSHYIKMYLRGMMVLLGIGLLSSGRLFNAGFIIFQFVGAVLIGISSIWWYKDYFGEK